MFGCEDDLNGVYCYRKLPINRHVYKGIAQVTWHDVATEQVEEG